MPPIIAMLLQAGRNIIAESQHLINIESNGSVKLKQFIPAVFGRLAINRFTEKTAVLMKQPTPGHGDYTVRNPHNAPSKWETEALKQFLTPGWRLNKGVGIRTGNGYSVCQIDLH